MKLKAWAAAAVAVLLLTVGGLSVSADTTYQYSYSYHNGELVESIPAFELRQVIDNDSLTFNVTMGGIVDVEVSDSTIYLVDESNSRIYLVDKTTYAITTFLKTIQNADGSIVLDEEGKQLTLKNPQSVFWYEQENELYIADTGAGRILVLDAADHHYKRTITRPEGMVSDAAFAPAKLVVNPIGKIYFTVVGSTEGIVELHNDGRFSCYFGTNEPEVSIIDYIWKSLSSETIRDQMGRTYAPEFSNIDVDAEGFIYATSLDVESQEKVFRFNGKGANVIRSSGNAELTGDTMTGLVNTTSSSAFVDIAVSDYGLYAVLDKTYGRVFIYNFDGYLLNVFSSRGNASGQLRTASGISWDGDNLIVVDSGLALAYIYTPTQFGQVMLDAERYYYNGRWAEADEQYRTAIKLNANYYVAYSGIGRNCLMNGEYKDAMYYFELSDDKSGYSQAYEEYRSQLIKENYGWVFAVIFVILGAIVWSEVRYQKKKKNH